MCAFAALPSVEFDFAEDDADGFSFAQMLDDFDEAVQRPAFFARAAAGVDEDAGFSWPGREQAALADGAQDLAHAFSDNAVGVELVNQIIGDVNAGVCGARAEAGQASFGGDSPDVFRPRILWRSDKAEDRVRAGEELALGFWNNAAFGEQAVPGDFTVGRFNAQNFLRHQSILARADTNEPALREESSARENQRPGENEIAERAGVEDQNVPADHVGYRAVSIHPPPRTMSLSKQTTA